VQERQPNTIKEGIFFLQVPQGFTFEDPTVKPSDGDYPAIRASDGLSFKNNATQVNNSQTRFINFVSDPADSSGNAKLRNMIYIDLGAIGLNRTSNTNGRLVITGLRFTAASNAQFGDIYLAVIDANGAGSTGIAGQSLKVGSRIDGSLDFSTVTNVPELISGRFAPESDAALFDSHHKTARVHFGEIAASSWWSLRETVFILNGEAKIRKVTIDKETAFDHSKTGYTLNGNYYPGDKNKYVTISANSMRLNDLTVQTDKTTSFEMDIWVSLQPGYEGDVVLDVGGGQELDALKPIVIAKAFSPVSLATEISDVKIGYQWQQAATFTMLESRPGALAQNSLVRISIDDGISIDNIYFAPDFTTEINSGSKMAINYPSVTGGAITFTVLRASSGEAARIRMSNVYVKIDRDVPASNNRPYKLVLGGDGISGNYKTGYEQHEPYFNVRGVAQNYLNVLDFDAGYGVLSRMVSVQIGSSKVLIGVNGEQSLTMDTAAYISAASNSTMVPVRFVSQALGISNEQVLWDERNRTVTINTSAKTIQFKIGSSELIIDGVKTIMYSPDAVPREVKAEITDNRSFLPFRHLGYALGIPVDWNDASRTAIYNNQ
jgi:hypothetical protein